jgi:hypothetical protein
MGEQGIPIMRHVFTEHTYGICNERRSMAIKWGNSATLSHLSGSGIPPQWMTNLDPSIYLPGHEGSFMIIGLRIATDCNTKAGQEHATNSTFDPYSMLLQVASPTWKIAGIEDHHLSKAT